jgi:hypothetical protein
MVLAGIVSGAVFLYLLGRQESIAGITVFWVLSQAAVNAVYASRFSPDHGDRGAARRKLAPGHRRRERVPLPAG